MSQIEGVQVIKLKKIADERGTIYHMLRSSDSHFTKFGEIYFSKIYREAIKGWHIHKQITLNYCVIYGMVKLVLFDMRETSDTKGNLMELFIGDDDYCLVIIPPGVANGHKGITETALLANVPDIPHDEVMKDEMIRIDPYNNEIPYNWERKDS
ncbi:dTDP-4-dehydrorhamnose 3,5-epimerase family protein [candidate division WOR-3 bacterium]|nr:dTDP-4-dehydrorhamnose 3,5-epimerase family protein [candidate division WOR-3 bacterium]